MSRDGSQNTVILQDDHIVTTRKVSRRSLLASTGIGLAAGVGALLAASAASAKDQKVGDMRDRTPPKIDGSRDTD